VHTDSALRLVSEKEAAQILGCSVYWLQRGRCRHYGPPYVKMNQPKGGIKYRIADLEAFIQANTINPNISGLAPARSRSQVTRSVGAT
jgi:hypothetical protein